MQQIKKAIVIAALLIPVVVLLAIGIWRDVVVWMMVYHETFGGGK